MQPSMTAAQTTFGDRCQCLRSSGKLEMSRARDYLRASRVGALLFFSPSTPFWCLFSSYQKCLLTCLAGCCVDSIRSAHTKLRPYRSSSARIRMRTPTCAHSRRLLAASLVRSPHPFNLRWLACWLPCSHDSPHTLYIQRQTWCGAVVSLYSSVPPSPCSHQSFIHSRTPEPKPKPKPPRTNPVAAAASHHFRPARPPRMRTRPPALPWTRRRNSRSRAAWSSRKGS